MRGKNIHSFPAIGIILACAVVPCRGDVAVPQVEGSSANLPNVIIILADDLGYDDLGVLGSPDILSPNIDALAATGVRYTDAYVTCPVCAPSRAALITGRYQQHFGFEDLGGTYPEPDFGIPQSEFTLAEYLREAGYATAIIGKWDLGIRPEAHPNQNGFDTFFGFLPGQNDYLRKSDEHTTSGGRGPAFADGRIGRRGPPGNGRAFAILRNDEIVNEPEYLTDAFSREAVKFVKAHARRPFLLYLAFNAPHTPMEATEEYLERYPRLTGGRRIYAAMVSAIDDAVGELITTLQEEGIENNTLIFFLSDNGGASGQGVALTNYASNHPLRGRKATFWEGGLRVPFILNWPGRLPGDQVSNETVSSLDIVPTVLDAVNLEPKSHLPLDGRNLITNSIRKTSTTQTTLFWRYHNHFAIRQGDWKLILLHEREPWLVNLTDDITESDNLAARHPERLRSLTSAIGDWNQELEPPLWTRRFMDEYGLIRRVPLPVFELGSGVSYQPDHR